MKTSAEPKYEVQLLLASKKKGMYWAHYRPDFSVAINRRSRCVSVRGWPVPSAQRTFGAAPQFDAGLMRRYPVSTRVNQVQNDDADCARPVEHSSTTQPRLF